MSLDFVNGSIDWSGSSKVLCHGWGVNGSEQLALSLEDQDVGLLLDVEHEVSQQEVFTGLLSHFLDHLESFLNVVVFVNCLDKSTKSVKILLDVMVILHSHWESNLLQSISVDLISLVWLSSSKDEGSNQVFLEALRSHLDHIKVVVTIELVVSQDSGEKTSVGQVLGSEAVDQDPVNEPSVKLSVLMVGAHTLRILLLDEFFHSLERCVLNNISTLSVQNLTSEESPEHLKHEV